MKPLKPGKRKRCKQCKTLFVPSRTLQAVCTPACGILWASSTEARGHAIKSRRAAHRADKERVKTSKQLKHEAQTAFNGYIRLRDAKLPCVSCLRHDAEIPDQYTGGKWDAGHFKSVGAYPGLRFEPHNCWKQCKHCNQLDDGKVREGYRNELINRIGPELVEWLESPHEPKRYRADDFRKIRDTYREKTRKLKKQREQTSESEPG